ncbi:MAG TPA: FAD-dependent monooxygenase [Alphaproteobacteria bacterium]
MTVVRSKETRPVVIVGAGPVGMTCALALHRLDVPVIVVEAEPAPVKDQRAASTHPPTMEILAGMGLEPQLMDRGLVSTTFRYFDRISGEMVCEFDCGLLKDETPYPFVLQHEQFKLVDTILKVLRGQPGFEVRFKTRYTGHEQSGSGVRVTIEADGKPETIEGSYLIGCDGGHSSVRRNTGIEFQGFTFPEKFIKIGTTFDFMSVGRNYVYRNYFSDPDEWCNLFKVRGDGPPGVWRCVFPCRVGEADEEALSPQGLEARLHKFFPGFSNFEIAYRSIYNVSQRVAATFRKGRVFVAGDSAHVNNPIGGMGLNGGIHDVANLAPRLAELWHGRGDDALLDGYTRQRHKAQHDYVQAQTIRNKRELEEKDPVVRRQHLNELRKTAETPELARKFLLNATLIQSLRTVAAVA